MSAKKLKVEAFDAKGNHYTLTLEGNFSRDKVLNLLDLMDLLGGSPDDGFERRSTSGGPSKFDKLSSLMKQYFSFRWFDSSDAQKLYEQEFGGPIGLSTVSTYLSRMTARGFLTRKGTGTRVRYRLFTAPRQEIVDGLKDNK